MSSHTPGPWHITAMAYRYDEHSENVRMLRVVEPSSAADVIIITGENGCVCEIVRGNMGVGPMAVGDARLIAAAPELREALKAMLDAFGNCGSPRQQRAAGMAMAAIKKTEHPYE